jgi:hypothetical protein
MPGSKFPLSVLAFSMLNIMQALSGPGDTTVVQTFTFDSVFTRRAVFIFPERGPSFEKVLMYYTLKCDSLTPHDKFPCGEWDYSTYTRIYRDIPGSVPPQKESFELGRFITPYGIRLDLGLHGFTWIYDVTDYEPLLHGMVALQAANGQELLDLRFLFIEGKPPRDVLSVRNIWPEGSYLYKDLADGDTITPVRLRAGSEAKGFRVRARISGHGHFGPLNCCEWVPKEHYLLIDEDTSFRWTIWRDCGMNPVHPQGGTWQFDRAGWCPGTFVDTYDFEITPSVVPGEDFTIDYTIEPYDTSSGESGGNYEMAFHLFEYGPPKFRHDAGIADILAPSTRHEYRRMNPVSLNPVIRIVNRGIDTLASLEISYGLENAKESRYSWSGRLGFMEQADIILPKPDWTGMEENSSFLVRIKSPNGFRDEYDGNNSMMSFCHQPVILPEEFILYVKTQGFGRAADNAFTVTGKDGQIVTGQDIFDDDSLYYVPVKLPEGAYLFSFTDKNEDGLIRHWWLWNEDREKVGENGSLQLLRKDRNLLMDLGYDWAEKRTLQFFVGEPR